jgi:DNA-binding Lrp family transcriptional regulator
MKGIEFKLLSELMKNSRRSDRELAKAIGVSQPTVSRAIKALEKNGFIKEYTIIPDFAKLGYELMAITLIKLRQELSGAQLDRATQLAKESLKKGPFEVVMVERGIGLGFSGVFISYHEDYSSYLNLRNWFKQFDFLEISRLESFLISLRDETRYRPFTFKTIAEHVNRKHSKLKLEREAKLE